MVMFRFERLLDVYESTYDYPPKALVAPCDSGCLWAADCDVYELGVYGKSSV